MEEIKSVKSKAKVAKPAVKKPIESHKYKAEVGKKKYTFKTKKDLCSNLGVSNKKVNKLISGEDNDDKLKISFI
mgnify:FL=1